VLAGQRDQSFGHGHDLGHALPPGDVCTLKQRGDCFART
jgi:hypothetical protein